MAKKKDDGAPKGMGLFDLDPENLNPHGGKRRKKGDPPAPRASIQDRFDVWIAEHEEVEALCVRFSRELLAAGRKHYGMKAIVERIRWHYAIKADVKTEWKISNDFTSRLARRVMEKYPDLKGFYALRPLRDGSAPEAPETP